METKQDPAPLHAECNHGQCNHGQATHTPTPWKHNGDFIRSLDDFYVAQTAAPTGEEAEANANAAFIVQAVNAHEQLLAVLRDILAWDDVNPTIPAVDVVRARQAIDRAEGK